MSGIYYSLMVFSAGGGKHQLVLDMTDDENTLTLYSAELGKDGGVKSITVLPDGENHSFDDGEEADKSISTINELDEGELQEIVTNQAHLYHNQLDIWDEFEDGHQMFDDELETMLYMEYDEEELGGDEEESE
jgi:hypothetical protein